MWCWRRSRTRARFDARVRLVRFVGFKSARASIKSNYSNEYRDSQEHDRGHGIDWSRLQTLPPRSGFYAMRRLEHRLTIRNAHFASSGITESKKTADIFVTRFAVA